MLESPLDCRFEPNRGVRVIVLKFEDFQDLVCVQLQDIPNIVQRTYVIVNYDVWEPIPTSAGLFFEAGDVIGVYAVRSPIGPVGH